MINIQVTCTTVRAVVCSILISAPYNVLRIQQLQSTVCVLCFLPIHSGVYHIIRTTDWTSTGMVAKCAWSAEPGCWNFPCPRSRLMNWSRETVSAVPSRVTPLILYTQAEPSPTLRIPIFHVYRLLCTYCTEIGRNPVNMHQIQPEHGDEQADAGRDCRNRLARPNSQARTGAGKYQFSLFS